MAIVNCQKYTLLGKKKVCVKFANLTNFLGMLLSGKAEMEVGCHSHSVYFEENMHICIGLRYKRYCYLGLTFSIYSIYFFSSKQYRNKRA